MKRMMFLVASAVALSGAMQAQSKGKTLIAYFSWGGNTREMAKQIQQQTGGDLFEITTVKPYPTDYNECVDVAKKEQQAAACRRSKGHGSLRRGFRRLSQLVGNDAAGAVHLFGAIRPER